MTGDSGVPAKSLEVVLVGGMPGTKVPAGLNRLLDWISAHHPEEADSWAILDKFEDLLLLPTGKCFARHPSGNRVTALGHKTEG